MPILKVIISTSVECLGYISGVILIVLFRYTKIFKISEFKHVPTCDFNDTNVNMTITLFGVIIVYNKLVL